MATTVTKENYQNVAYGDEGSAVSDMQKLLVSAGYDVGPAGIDGIFGPDTLKAVKKFQKDQKIAQSGVYNYETMVALKDATSVKTTKKSSSKTKKKTQPSLTLVKKDETTIVVTNKDGEKVTITYVLGVPASVSGIGSLSASYTKEFSDEEIRLLQTVAYQQQRDYSSSQAYDELMRSVENYSKTTAKGNSAVNFSTSYSSSAKGAYGSPKTSTNYTISNTTGVNNTSKYNPDLVGSDNQTETPKIEIPGSYDEFYRIGIHESRNTLIHSLGLYEATSPEYLKLTSETYNRFKMAVPDSQLRSSFAHVFFVKPSCNIPYTNGVLDSSFQSSEEFSYVYKHSPNLVRELSDDTSNTQSDFSFVLSNAAASFSLTDEQIDTDIYGKSFIGYKIAFGRHDVESKTAGEFSVTFHDDRDLHIYQLIKLWINYIAGAYRGLYAPKDSTILNHIMDYAGACYYILTAEDGETILFWSKYYGVFPKTIPSNQYSWAYGNLLSAPQLDVSFMYSFKEDYNPAALIEFNRNAHVGDAIGEHGTVLYEAVYDKNLGHVGSTWVGVPFIETVNENGRVSYKLRFRPGPNYG